MDTGVRDLEVVFFKANTSRFNDISWKRVRWPPIFFYVFYLILSFSTASQSFKKICVWEVFGRERP